jgi:hypothetical protein
MDEEQEQEQKETEAIKDTAMNLWAAKQLEDAKKEVDETLHPEKEDEEQE